MSADFCWLRHISGSFTEWRGNCKEILSSSSRGQATGAERDWQLQFFKSYPYTRTSCTTVLDICNWQDKIRFFEYLYQKSVDYDNNLPCYSSFLSISALYSFIICIFALNNAIQSWQNNSSYEQYSISNNRSRVQAMGNS